LSYQPGIVSTKSHAAAKAEFLGHGEVKSATADGEPAGASSRGLLRRRHVSPSEIRLMGKESNCLELVEAGLLGDWREILASYGRGSSRPVAELLVNAPAVALARAWGVSIRTVRAWRKQQRNRAHS
jgi:hypothetical protein